MATNPQPSSILNKKVQFGTVNNTNGSVINEPFRVFGPYAQGVQVTWLRTGNKAVIPLTNETGEGSFFLKIHYPNNNTYDDGYKDFIQRVPPAYITALNKWIDNGRTPSTSGVIRYRKLSFTAYGQQTSRVNKAVSFEVRFNYRGANVGSGGNTGGIPTNTFTNSDATFSPNTNNGGGITENNNQVR